MKRSRDEFEHEPQVGSVATILYHVLADKMQIIRDSSLFSMQCGLLLHALVLLGCCSRGFRKLMKEIESKFPLEVPMVVSMVSNVPFVEHMQPLRCNTSPMMFRSEGVTIVVSAAEAYRTCKTLLTGSTVKTATDILDVLKFRSPPRAVAALFESRLVELVPSLVDDVNFHLIKPRLASIDPPSRLTELKQKYTGEIRICWCNSLQARVTRIHEESHKNIVVYKIQQPLCGRCQRETGNNKHTCAWSNGSVAHLNPRGDIRWYIVFT